MSRAIDIGKATTAIGVLSIAVWNLILALKGIPISSTDALKEIPGAIGYVAGVVWIFEQWAWRLCIFRRWLVLVPNLNGTWKGEIRSSWVDPDTGKKMIPVQVFLVVRQTLFRISCIQLTKESTSYSRAASIEIDPDHQSTALEFTYSNSPRVSVQYRSRAHDGAAVLNVVSEPSWKLVGKYW